MKVNPVATNINSEMKVCPDWNIKTPSLTWAINSRGIIISYPSCCCSEMVAFTRYEYERGSYSSAYIWTPLGPQLITGLQQFSHKPHICTLSLRRPLCGGHSRVLFLKREKQCVTLSLENYNLIVQVTFMV